MNNPNNTMEEPYYAIDHSHCWESKKPPCGQRIEHLFCCLCKNMNPLVDSEIRLALKEKVQEIGNSKVSSDETNPLYEPDSDKARVYNEAIDDVITILNKEI